MAVNESGRLPWLRTSVVPQVPTDDTQKPSHAAEWLDAMQQAGVQPDLLCFNKERARHPRVPTCPMLLPPSMGDHHALSEHSWMTFAVLKINLV